MSETKKLIKFLDKLNTWMIVESLKTNTRFSEEDTSIVKEIKLIVEWRQEYEDTIERDFKSQPESFTWTPTPENINALPEPIRIYLHDLETICDPAGMVQEIALLKENIKALQKLLEEEKQ